METHARLGLDTSYPRRIKARAPAVEPPTAPPPPRTYDSDSVDHRHVISKQCFRPPSFSSYLLLVSLSSIMLALLPLKVYPSPPHPSTHSRPMYSATKFRNPMHHPPPPSLPQCSQSGNPRLGQPQCPA